MQSNDPRDNKEKKQAMRPARTLDEIHSKDDVTLENVYELGLEHDMENLEPEKNESARPSAKRRQTRTRDRG